MQLGSRWQVGQPPHPGVPGLLHPAIAAAERRLNDASQQTPTGGSWTLTWLEGRPRVELIDAAGAVRADIGVDATGRVTERVRPAAGGPGADPAAGDATGVRPAADDHDDDDDDDWLS